MRASNATQELSTTHLTRFTTHRQVPEGERIRRWTVEISVRVGSYLNESDSPFQWFPTCRRLPRFRSQRSQEFRSAETVSGQIA